MEDSNLQMKSNKEEKKIYQWNPNWADQVAHKVDINKAVYEINSIKEAYGEITPSLLVQSSRNKNSVFHSFFEWDNQKAADAYRRIRASQILRHVDVKIIKNNEPVFIRAYEITSRSENNKLGKPLYIQHDKLSAEGILGIKKIIISDLRGIIKRITAIDKDNAITNHLKKAISELEKEAPVIQLPDNTTADLERNGRSVEV